MVDNKPSAVESAVLSGSVSTAERNALRTAHTTANALRTAHTTANQIHSSTLKRRGCSRGFTLAELLVSVGVLVLLVFLFTQLLTGAATIITLGHKRMDADSEARQVFDRMAIDFAQMVKRSDVDYFAKGTVAPNSVGGLMTGNDQIAFYSSAQGYYPPTGSQSPVSLVAYRVNSDPASSSYHRLERLSKGLVWNGVSSTDTPVVFMNTTISATWPAATSSSASDTAYEVIGPDVFRFEYYYLVRTGTSPFLAFLPCFGSDCVGGVNGFRSVVAIVVDIALIDPKSKVLLTDANIATIIGNTTLANNSLSDFRTDDSQPGKTLNRWQNYLNNLINPSSSFFNPTLPLQAVSGVRVYERYFYLNQ